MNFTRMSLAATAAVFLLTAGIASACDGHAKAKGTSTASAGQSDAAKSDAAKSDAAKSDAAKAATVSGSGSGCASKAAGTATATTVSGSGSGCASKAAKASGEGCCAKGKAGATAVGGGGCAEKAKSAGCCAKGEPVMASLSDTDDAAACKFKAGAVSLKGTVLCNHCNLKKSETCQTMFRTEGGCLFALSGDKAAGLREAAVGGNKLVRIKGEVNAAGELVPSSYRVVRTLDSGASAM